MFYGYLKGHEEYLFKQSSFGGVYHIIIDASEYLAWIADGIDGLPNPELRVDTWCGRNYKYGEYSNITKKDNGVRNACEYCFVEYDPEDQVEQKQEADRTRKVLHGDLPF